MAAGMWHSEKETIEVEGNRIHSSTDLWSIFPHSAVSAGGWEAFVVPGAPPTGQAIEKIKYIREAGRKWKKWSCILRASG